MDAMSTVQRELMQRLLEQSFSDNQREGIPPRTPGRVPLTPAQASIWFFTQLFPDSTEYNVFDLLRIPRMVGRATLSRALRTIVERHDGLRLRIVVEDGEPYQYDQPPFEPELDWFDLSGLSEADAEREAERIANRYAQLPLPVDRTPLFKVAALALPTGELLLVLLIHHIITDYVTTVVLLEEINALLAGERLGPPPSVGFLDYAAWLAATADPVRVAAELDHWTARLGGELPILALPTDRPRPATPSRHGHSVAMDLPPGVVAALRRLAGEEGTTLFVAFLAVYKVLLMRLTEQRDIVVGTALAGRDHPDAERIVGCFVKSVALRTDVDRAATFRDIVRAAHATVAEAHDNQAVPFERVVDALAIRRELNVHPVYQTFFGFLSEGEPQLAGAEINPIKVLDYDSAKWDVAVSLWETGKGINGIIESSADLFDHATVARFRDMYLHLCERLVAQPDARVGVHPLVSTTERHRILNELNEYERVTVPYATLAEPFELQVERTPEAVAVETGDRVLTYRALNEWANRLAHSLRERGVRRGERVALLMERSLETLVAMYAVAKSGAAYVPLDPDLPDARLAFMLEDTEPRLVIADRDRLGRVPAGGWTSATFADLDRKASGGPVTDLVNDGAGDNLSHLLYTSGSTGRPKAVACPVATAVADILDMHDRLAYRRTDVVLFKTSYGFDTSLWEVFWPLYVGARVVICPPGAEKDPVHLIEVIERHKVTVVDLTPTVLQPVLDHIEPGRCGSLRYLHTGGELVTPSLRDEFYARFATSGVELINGYGPTETACVVSTRLQRDPADPAVPLGRPHAHFRLYVLDEELNVAPIGVPGEAYLSAEVGITHGYYNRPELTAERYLPDPYGPPGCRMYRTGDVCRYRADGTIEILGRVDSQVKIRGIRVELAEVEAVLRDHPDVAGCAVLPVGAGADQVLAAFVRMRRHATFDARALLDHAARSLPRHMVPGGIQEIERIPVNVNGKTDVQALRRVWRRQEAPPSVGAPVAPANELERGLAQIFRDVLGVSQVGVTDNFFDLGGHSLRIFKLVAACEQRLRVRPRVADVFAAPTVRQLAERIVAAGGGQELSLVPLHPNAGRPLIVFVHASSGSALPFYDVADGLGDDFSTYAMQAPDDDLDGAYTIENLAAHYVAAVDQVRELSPVFLVGWSMGGCVVLEMARAWRARGVEPAGVALLDSWPPPSLVDGINARAEYRAAVNDLDVIALEGIDVALGEEAPAELDRLRRGIVRNRTAFLDYQPKPFDGEVHLLRAADAVTEPAPAFARLRSVHGYGWTELVSGLAVTEVAGTHFSMLGKENATALAGTIREVVETAIAFGEI